MNTDGTGFNICKECQKPNHFEIVLLQTTRKENNWKTEEKLERAVVILETERIKGSNPWCLWWWWSWWWYKLTFNLLTPNDPYMGRTAPLTSKPCILHIYSTNIGTEYFKHALYSPVFSNQNSVCFIMLTCLVPVLLTFYIQGVLKLKKNNSGAKRLKRRVKSHLSSAGIISSPYFPR